MSSDDGEQPPRELLQLLSHFQSSRVTVMSTPPTTQESSVGGRPYNINFISSEVEIEYLAKIKENCTSYNGDPDQLLSWLRETGAYISREGIPETDHPFIIRHLSAMAEILGIRIPPGIHGIQPYTKKIYIYILYVYTKVSYI